MAKPRKPDLFRRHFVRKLAIRPLDRGDLPALARLFHETVRRIDRRDYGAAKRRAWSPRVRPPAFWHRRLAGQQAFAAVRKGKLVGFASLAPPGVIDLLYVHHRRQGRGVGRALIGRITDAARRGRMRQLTAEASIGARPFFQALGFRETRIGLVHLRGRPLRRYRMERRLD
jgi:putative acetyltransferase